MALYENERMKPRHKRLKPSQPYPVSSSKASFFCKSHRVVFSGEQTAFYLPKKRLQIATAVQKPSRASCTYDILSVRMRDYLGPLPVSGNIFSASTLSLQCGAQFVSDVFVSFIECLED